MKLPRFTSKSFGVMPGKVMTIDPMADRVDRQEEFFRQSPIGLTGIQQPIARSGESCVYKGLSKESGEVAIKVGCRPLVGTCISAAQEYRELNPEEALNAAQKDLREERTEKIRRTQGRMAQLHDYFGDSVIPEDLSLQTVPMNGTYLEYCLRSHTLQTISVPPIRSDGHYDLETIVRVQPWLESLHDPNRAVLTTRYAEIQWDNALGTIPEKDYVAVTRALVSPETSGSSKLGDMDELLRIQGSPLLSSFVARAQDDPGLRRTMCNFLTNLKDYVDDTGGQIIDVIGKDNVIVGDSSACTMSDGLYADEGPVAAVANRALDALAEGDRPSRKEMNRLYNVLNFMRGMNIEVISAIFT